MIRITGLKFGIDHTKADILKKINKLFFNKKNIIDFKISNKSIDARKKNDIKIVYSVDVEFNGEEEFINDENIKRIEEVKYIIPNLSNIKIKRPVIIGSGPAGIFAGLILARAGLKPIIIERGKQVKERVQDVYKFFETGILDEESNVQFGEGGAGTFSDGKLNTNSHNKRIKVVIDELILAGADENISYISKPHIGTDVLIDIVKNIRKTIEDLGGEYRFSTKFVDFKEKNNELQEIIVENNGLKYSIKTDYCILAIGHSARDTFYLLKDKAINISKKTFAVGFRIEHKQKFIDKCQYGNSELNLPPAEYKINYRTKFGRGVYTFCMCPGGVVVPSSSEKGYLVVNGMSYNKRDLENANSAILVNVNPEDLDDDVMSGVEFQREIEKKAFELGGKNYKAPVQLVTDYIKGKKSEKLLDVKPSYSIGYVLEDLNKILPKYLNESLKEGLLGLNTKIRDFSSKGAILTGVESRSSSPIRINRDEKMYSNIKGLIPSGEGAGYAGGIMTAAVDGIKCAERILEEIQSVSK